MLSCKRAYFAQQAPMSAACLESHGGATAQAAVRPQPAALVTHRGLCHCRAVTFEVDAPADLVVWDCNCSICALKRNTHFIVPAAQFRLLSGGDVLKTYTFGTGVAKHQFCGTCGICPFYRPRSNPDGVAVTIWAIDRATVKSIETRFFDGQNWEGYIAGSGIASFSKPAGEA